MQQIRTNLFYLRFSRQTMVFMAKKHFPLYRTTLILHLLIFLFASDGFAQRTITGKVIDAQSREGLIGANVVVKGSVIGTVTDFDGDYSLTVPEGYDVLVFSYTGYKTQEISLTSSNVINVTLDFGQELQEVVLIGYGSVRREDVTGTLQSVSSESFNRGAITGAQELLAGKIAGVVITPGAAPGDGAAIRIRGESSLSASNDPLIVIDGVPIDNGGISGGRNPLNVINPNDIETFTVLKDASAAAIYGNRAAAGVILITTKKGKAFERLRIGYNANISIGSPSNYVDVLDADEYRSLMAIRYDSTHPAHGLLGDANTNWQKEIYQNALGHDHNLYASGGIASIPYRVSLGYTWKDGILRTDNFDRITGGLSLNPGFLDNTLQFQLNAKAMFTKNQFADRGAIGNAVNFDPTQSIYGQDTLYGGFTTWRLNDGIRPNTIAPVNPLALLELRDDHSRERRYIVNLATDYRFWFLPSLRANLNLAYDYGEGEGEVYVPTHAAFAYHAVTGGGVDNSYGQTKKNSLLEFYLNYKTQLNKHTFDIIGGYSWQHFEQDSWYFNSDVAHSPAETRYDSINPSEYYLLSFFGRANYAFNDRYLLTLTVRQDGTSKFSPDNRWGLFPAAALGIKIIDRDQKMLNSLKFRAGWGITGQQEIGDYYAYLARYRVGNEFAQYQFGDNYYRTLRPEGYDANIKWEETETYNLGLDFSIIRHRLSGSLDFYRRYTTDLLNVIPTAAGSNLTNYILTNVGNMLNRGIELSLFTTPVRTSVITWDLAVNVAHNHNEITRLTVFDDPAYKGVPTGGIAGGVGSNIQIHSVGYAPRAFYVFEQMYDENGNFLEDQFVDRNGDGIINDEDKYRYRKPAADYTIGFTNRLEIGQFDFSFAGRASIGNYVYNNVQTDGGYLNRLYLSTGGQTLWNVHRSAVDLNVENQGSLTFSDHFVKRADFLKVDHITIGYNFNKIVGEFFRIYATAQNPFVLTRYDGLDPEIFGGIDNNIYPRPRTFLFGLNVEF